jgi:DNA-binding GntR family transcriptional regulator
MGAVDNGHRRDAASHAGKLEELFRELEDAILLARIAPGQRLVLREFAALGRATLRDAEAILPRLAATGMLAFDGVHVAVKALDQNAMFATLPRRMELEIRIVRAAAEKATDAQLRAMRASEALQSRCALVGDMEGLMAAERVLERLLAEASGLLADGAELREIKVEFRRAWCAVNRFRSFTNVSSIRTELVAAVAQRNPDAAEAQVRVFFDHLLRSY